MLGGASEFISGNSQAPPVKPWENSNSTSLNAEVTFPTSTFAPPPPPPPFSISPAQDPFSQANTGSMGYGGYYGGGYGGSRFGYPASNYSSGFSSYSYPYCGNNGAFSGGPPAPGNYITSSLENTTRPLFDSLNHVLQAINHVACFVDSTVFAVWTSITAAGSIIAAIKNVKNVYLRRWAESIKLFLQKTKANLRTESGRKKLILLISVAASIPVLLKALHMILKMENDTETALVLRSQMGASESTSIKSNEDDLSSKLVFIRALYPFDPVDKDVYLKLDPGDVILISKEDESKLANPTPTWIAGKLRNGSTGFFPTNYVTVIK